MNIEFYANSSTIVALNNGEEVAVNNAPVVGSSGYYKIVISTKDYNVSEADSRSGSIKVRRRIQYTKG
jgi:hypothetical protein